MGEEKKENKNSNKFKNYFSKENFKKLSHNYWAIASIVLAILLILVLVFPRGSSGIGANIAAGKVISFVEDNGGEASLISSEEENGLYKVTISLQGQALPVYVTKDGKYLMPNLIPLDYEETESVNSNTPQEIPKSDKPIVELFVMTHCPYGTQAEKGFIPFMESVGNIVDAKIRFVHYFMHQPEENETPIQVCIREEQSDKFLSYLREFLVEGNSENALIKAGIDKLKMQNCIDSGKWKEYYAEDSALSEGYGVQGSPTLVVNGVIANPQSRSPKGYLDLVCSSFNNLPSQCSSLTLSTANPTPMWGWDSTTSTTASAQC